MEAIGFGTSLDQGGLLDVAVPSWRPDCELEVDVIEEIARHVGYETLGRTVPKSVVPGRLSPVQARRRTVRQVLYGLGISEAMPNPFLAPDDLARAGLDADGLTLANPLVAEESVLRTSLRPGMFKALAYNASHRSRRRGACSRSGTPTVPPQAVLPDEREMLGVALAGREGPAILPVVQEVVAALGLAERLEVRQTVPERSGRDAPGSQRPDPGGRARGRRGGRGRSVRAGGLRHPWAGGLAGAGPLHGPARSNRPSRSGSR